MWISEFPVTTDHCPLVAEKPSSVNSLVFNAGLTTKEVPARSHWESYAPADVQPEFLLELRVDNRRLVTSMFMRIGIKESQATVQFVAVGENL